eukprot:scaffold111125_cov69-Phaeocystis_antarctica.AAC.2
MLRARPAAPAPTASAALLSAAARKLLSVLSGGRSAAAIRPELSSGRGIAPATAGRSGHRHGRASSRLRGGRARRRASRRLSGGAVWRAQERLGRWGASSVSSGLPLARWRRRRALLRRALPASARLHPRLDHCLSSSLSLGTRRYDAQRRCRHRRQLRVRRRLLLVEQGQQHGRLGSSLGSSLGPDPGAEAEVRRAEEPLPARRGYARAGLGGRGGGAPFVG